MHISTTGLVALMAFSAAGTVLAAVLPYDRSREPSHLEARGREYRGQYVKPGDKSTAPFYDPMGEYYDELDTLDLESDPKDNGGRSRSSRYDPLKSTLLDDINLDDEPMATTDNKQQAQKPPKKSWNIWRWKKQGQTVDDETKTESPKKAKLRWPIWGRKKQTQANKENVDTQNLEADEWRQKGNAKNAAWLGGKEDDRAALLTHA